MNLFPIGGVTVKPNRQRREFLEKDLADLTESIRTKGLLHAIVCRPGPDNLTVELVAGERRLRAMEDLYALGEIFYHNGDSVPANMIPYTLLGNLSPLEVEEAELEENIRRVDLTWQERADATARLVSLRQRQAEAEDKPAPTRQDIALEIYDSTDKNAGQAVANELIAARNLDNPEVRAAKSLKEALKVIRRQEQTAHHQALAERFGAMHTGTQHTVLQADSLQWLRGTCTETFDVILTDPPYGINAQDFNSGGCTLGTSGTHGYDDSAEGFVGLIDQLPDELFRVAKAEAHLYLFCDIDWFSYLKEVFSSVGWWVHRTPLIWNKPTANRVPWPEHGPRRTWEMILYAVKGKRPCNTIEPDVITCNSDENLGHQAQKPVALFENLLKRSVRPGDSVLDCFAGSGPILPAAHALKCKATAVELDPANYGICLSRLKELT